MTRTICPSCEESLKLADHLKIGQKVTCPHCTEKLLVIGLNPVELEWSDSEDWESREVTRKRKSPKKRSRKTSDWHDPRWYEEADWEADDDDRGTKSRRTGRGKGRRHNHREELHQDF